MENSSDNRNDDESIEVSVIMPCLNEEKSVGICIEKCLRVFRESDMRGEVIVVDNGSTDRSREIVKQSGARLVVEPRKGYGSAYLKGFAEARGRYFVMADSDNTYDFLELPKFIIPLRSGEWDFVIGSRLGGKIEGGKGTMPWLHRYVRNPALTTILRKLFGVRNSDVYCGMRSMKKEIYRKLNLKSTGMEFALEMVINVAKHGFKVKEVPISYGLRIGESKLRTVKDGWRSLRFILLYSPTFLFLVPGAVLMLVGGALTARLYFGSISLGGESLSFHFMFLGSLMAISGYQLINLGLFAKVYSYSARFENEQEDKFIQYLYRNFSLERMILGGVAVSLVGLFFAGEAVAHWLASPTGQIFEVPRLIISITLMVLGIQIIFNGFFYSILRIEKK